MDIAVVGTGYVGLVTGTCFADLGNTVTCIDNNSDKLAVLNKGQSPFYEPGLSERMTRSIRAGRLQFSADSDAAVMQASVVFIAVGTPPLPSGEADLSAVFAVADSILSYIQRHKKTLGFRVLVTKSTVPVGTGQQLMAKRDALGLSDDEVAIVSNPEFLREGTAIHDFFHPDRIVLGSSSEAGLDLVAQLYHPLYRRETPIVRTSIQTSELSKYAANAFLATKISFINEMANVCERTGADVADISKIMGLDGRIGRYFLHPGPGYGGSCFPKDTQALVQLAEKLDYSLEVVKAVEAVNDRQKAQVIPQLIQALGDDLTGKTIAILGLAFKPNTDDIREASSLVIITELLKRGARVQAVDPEVKRVPLFEGVAAFSIKESAYAAANQADALVLVTEWNAYRELNLTKIISCMRLPFFFDLRNVYTPTALKQAGFFAYVIGRSNTISEFETTSQSD